MKLQELPPGLFYHPFVKLSDAPLEFKYGVISTEDLCSDLNHWDHFYAAGRLQKPVGLILTVLCSLI